MKKSFAVLFCVFCLIWYFNYCTPLIFDDYVYSYVWTAGAMHTPLSETAQMINSFGDILHSQWNHYFSWGGRTVAHFLLQFFLWKGKNFFNVINALCFLLLIFEIQWLINKGDVCFFINKKDILWIFSVLWIFTFMVGDIFVWMSLSCNYLWTTVILLAFLLPYERFYFNLKSDHLWFKINFFFFLFGIVAGWTNENVPCFIILILCVYLYKKYNKGIIKISLLVGLFGFITGYLLLMLAPGNYVRYELLLENGVIYSGILLIQENFNILLKIVLLRFALYFYVFTNIFYLHNAELDEERKKELIISAIFVFLSISSLIIMLFAPEFRYRSSFPSLIFLIISSGIIRNVKKSLNEDYNYHGKKNNRIKWLKLIGGLYVLITVTTSLYMYSLQLRQTELMLSQIDYEKQNPSGKVLVVKERPYALHEAFFYNAVTGFHLVFPYSILTDENWWINRDVSMYYGIHAIKTERGEAFQ